MLGKTRVGDASLLHATSKRCRQFWMEPKNSIWYQFKPVQISRCSYLSFCLCASPLGRKAELNTALKKVTSACLRTSVLWFSIAVQSLDTHSLSSHPAWFIAENKVFDGLIKSLHVLRKNFCPSRSEITQKIVKYWYRFFLWEIWHVQSANNRSSIFKTTKRAAWLCSRIHCTSGSLLIQDFCT